MRNNNLLMMAGFTCLEIHSIFRIAQQPELQNLLLQYTLLRKITQSHHMEENIKYMSNSIVTNRTY